MPNASAPTEPRHTVIARAPALSLAIALALGLGTATTTVAAATTVFRSVDAEGRVVFSDTPPAPGVSVETIVIQDPASFTPPRASQAESNWEWEPDADAEDDGTSSPYAMLRIATPGADETVRDNAGNVSVVAEVEPELRPGHRLVLLLNGVAVADSTGTGFLLEDVDRGTHSLALRIVDDAGSVRIESAPTTFHLQRFAPLLAPNRPTPRN